MATVVFTVSTASLELSHQKVSVREVALISVLGAVTAMLRLPFTFIPNVQPCTSLIICIGISFGPHAGFFVGALTPLISNFLLGHGPWTPLQMYSWGMIGALSSLLNSNIGRWRLGAVGLSAGYMYGFIMNIWFCYTFLQPITLNRFVMAELQGLPFDTMHAIGNFTFLTLLGKRVLQVFDYFKRL
ncbi:MAG: ECF transporter S component [Candidatus Bathyarchaeia archaeon]